MIVRGYRVTWADLATGNLCGGIALEVPKGGLQELSDREQRVGRVDRSEGKQKRATPKWVRRKIRRGEEHHKNEVKHI